MAEGLKVMNQVLSRYPDIKYTVESYELGGVSVLQSLIPFPYQRILVR